VQSEERVLGLVRIELPVVFPRALDYLIMKMLSTNHRIGVPISLKKKARIIRVVYAVMSGNNTERKIVTGTRYILVFILCIVLSFTEERRSEKADR